MSSEAADRVGAGLDPDELAARLASASRSHPDAGGLLIAPASRRHQIVHLLREAIVRGELAPGEQLRQEHVCEAFGVSPTPVREALRQLESEGLLVHFPNRGVFVAESSPEELFEVLLPIRLTLEQYALGRNPASIGNATLRELERLVVVMEDAARRDDFAAATDADLRFHEVCVLEAQVPYVTSMWQAVHSRIRVELFRFGTRLRPQDIPGQHRDLLRVLQGRDPEAIRAALQEHILSSARELLGSGGREEA